MNAIEITETLQRNFVRYLLTTFNVEQSDSKLAMAIRRNLESPGVLFRGPFLELNPPYTTGHSIRDLVKEGVLNKSLCQLQDQIDPPHERPLPPDRPLYLHQENAIRRVLKQNRNVVVASGTGSGKTECFLIPILHDLLCDPSPGVRAILIYPMNALVNDQLDRLRRLLAGTDITFGRYTSELKDSEAQGRKANPGAPINEVISREVIRGNPSRNLSPAPPNILVTNYAMLEYLLLRPEDSPIFDSSRLRFLCLDEAHTYTGAQGIEVSMLLRRLKQRLSAGRGQIRCIATSATLTEDDRGAAARFASSLFGEDFNDEDVIFGVPQDLNTINTATDPAAQASSWLKISDDLRERLRQAFGSEKPSPELIDEIAHEFLRAELVTANRIEAARQEAHDGKIGRFLWALFHSNPQLAELRALMAEEPVELQTAGRAIFDSPEISEDADDDAVRAEAVCRLVEIGAMARESSDSVPLLPARYHLFTRAPQGAWLCLNPNCKAPEGAGWSHLYLEKREHCSHCEMAVYELTACRNCGQPYVRAFHRDGILSTEGKYERDTNGQRYFTWSPISQNEELDLLEEGTPAPSENNTGSHIVICLRCRRPNSRCICSGDSCLITLHQVQDAKGTPKETLSTCPRCNSRSTSGGEIATSIRVGSNAPLAVLTEELYRLSPTSPKAEIREKSGEGRKLLAFTDSRQGAARYAAYLQTTVEGTLYRHLIAKAASDLHRKGMVPDVEELSTQCMQLATQHGLYGEHGLYASDAEKRRRKLEATRRIMGEFCSRTDARHSLWALGLVNCDISFPEGILPDDALCSRFGLSPHEMLTVVQTLLDTIRQNKCVAMPEGVRHDDDVFGNAAAAVYIQLTRSMTEASNPYVRDWVSPKDRFAVKQSRFDYVRRIFTKNGKKAENDEIKEALQDVWRWIQEHRVFVRTNTGTFQINYERLIFPTDIPWYRCNRCLRISPRLISEQHRICPQLGCEGTLESFEADMDATNDHYRGIFSRRPIAMRVEEHTAQLQPEAGKHYQDGFINGDINILSCSTTFEMGVDVGDLQTVVLNNVPPTVANYRQRAGRAGRRASGTAFILTYAAPRPHDRVYFSQPTKIIAGEVAVPHLAIGNRIISGRHLNATLFGHFLRWLSRAGRQDLLQTGAFFTPNLPDGRHIDYLPVWKEDCEKELQQIVETFFDENPDSERQTVNGCLTRLTEDLEKQKRNFERWLNEYDRLRDQAMETAKTTKDRSEKDFAKKLWDRYDAMRDRLLGESLIDFLCREGVLPSYSFPIDLVELRLPAGRQYRGDRYAGDWLRLERDKKLAIVEYAPGSEVVADKHLWKSVGVRIRETLNVYQFRECEVCHNLERSERGGLNVSQACSICGNSTPGDTYNYADPDGFTTDLTAPVRKAGLQVDRGANRSRSFLRDSGQSNTSGSAINQLKGIRYEYRRDGTLITINGGEDTDGFILCNKCGVYIPEKKQNRKKRGANFHVTPWGEKGCDGMLANYHLGHSFGSDTLHLRFDDSKDRPLPSGKNISFWRSLTYALLEGASLALQIERRDLDGVVRPFTVGASVDPEENYSQEIVLFDNVPGGAGHVRQIVERLEAVLRQALVVALCTECEEETSCPSCLRNYGNQIYWEELKRGQVARFLESVINETFPSNLDHLAPGATQVATVDRSRWLAQQVINAGQEAFISVNEVSRTRPNGIAKNWLEILQDLLRCGVKTSLVIEKLPPADRTSPEIAGLRNHLSLLVQDGLQLYTLDNIKLPLWNIVLDPAGEQCQAIMIEGAEHKLFEKTGSQGLIHTLRPDAVREIMNVIQKQSFQPITPKDLEFPPNVRVIHIQEGEILSEADLFADVFRLPLSSLSINDRYLRSDHHEKRLRAYLSLVPFNSGLRTKVMISTVAAETNPSSGRWNYRTSFQQEQMFKRIQKDYPHIDLHHVLERAANLLPHDRFLVLGRLDGTTARIGIGAGLDFIRHYGSTVATDIIIEDPV